MEMDFCLELVLYGKLPETALPVQWFSAFLVPQPFNTVPHVVVTPTTKLFSLLIHNCNSATVNES